MFSRAFWLLFGLAVFEVAVAIPKPPARQSIPRQAPTASEIITECPVWPNNALSFPHGCLHYDNVVVDGGKAQVWSEADIPEASSDERTKLWILMARRATKQVLGFYTRQLKENLGTKTINAVITMVRSDKSLDDRGSNGVTASGQPCHVAIQLDPPKNVILVAHLIAHELYHCVQYREQKSAGDGFEWVVDGSATFFAYFQYPLSPPKDGNAPHFYDPAVALYQQQYTSSLFFHSLHNSDWSLLQIDKWVNKRKLHDNKNAELADLAADSKLAEGFGNFAKTFHQKRIYFDTKKLLKIKTYADIPTEPPKDISLAAVGAQLPLEFGTQGIPSWTFKKYSARLQAKQTVTTTLTWDDTPAPKVIVWFRIFREGKKPSTWVKTLPKVHSGCDGAVTYEFLVVPVTDKEAVKGSLHFKREKDDECSCSVKPSGSVAIKRTPTIDRRDIDTMVARQEQPEGNYTSSCAASFRTAVPVPEESHVMNIAEVVDSIMRFSPSQIVTSTAVRDASPTTIPCVNTQISPVHNTGSYNGTARINNTTTMSRPTQGRPTPLPPYTFKDGTRISKSRTPTETPSPTSYSQVLPTSQVLEPTSAPTSVSQILPTSTILEDTTIQDPPTSTSSSDPSSPSDEDRLDGDEGWDGTWPIPEGSTLAEDTDTEDDDFPSEDNDDDDAGTCGQSCMIGSWTADKASMGIHSKKPAYWYLPHGSDHAGTKYSATYELTFKTPPSGEEQIPGSTISFSLHQELIEEQQTPFNDYPNSSRASFHVISKSIVDSVTAGYSKIVDGTETGSVYYRQSEANMSSEGKVKWDDHEWETLYKYDTKAPYGPSELTYYYNCTGDTMFYERGDGKITYVFHRG